MKWCSIALWVLCVGVFAVLPLKAQEGEKRDAPPLRPFRVATDYPSIQAAIFLDAVGRAVIDIDIADNRFECGLKADTLLNLAPTDVTKIEHPKRGDIALDNGTNTQSGKPGLAVYDGEKWVFMN